MSDAFNIRRGIVDTFAVVRDSQRWTAPVPSIGNAIHKLSLDPQQTLRWFWSVIAIPQRIGLYQPQKWEVIFSLFGKITGIFPCVWQQTQTGDISAGILNPEFSFISPPPGAPSYSTAAHSGEQPALIANEWTGGNDYALTIPAIKVRVAADEVKIVPRQITDPGIGMVSGLQVLSMFP
jgi:hypothetical protein